MTFRILYRDSDYVAIDKPAGFHVHPPEDQSHRIARSLNCLALLRDQLGHYVYPVHRLDRATSGVLIYGLSSEAAGLLAERFRRQVVLKTYFCVVRGWVDEGLISQPLKADRATADRACVAPLLLSETAYRCVARVELPLAVDRYPSSRYSLVRVVPKTGRRHQIRLHFKHESHPLIGDSVYGNGPHNQAFRAGLGISGLLLKAYSLRFEHPRTGMPIEITSRWTGTWHKVFDLFGVCPYEFGLFPHLAERPKVCSSHGHH